MLEVTLLGTGGGMPMPKRYLSSMLIGYNGRKILIDCGEGTQVSMRQFHTGYRSLDIILLTHYHGDHTFGLPGLLATLANSERVEPITIVGPPGLSRIIESVISLIGYLPFDLHLIEDPKSVLELELGGQDLCISTIDLEHSSPCLGYKIYVPRDPKFLPEKAEELNIPVEFWSRLQKGEVIEHDEKVFEPSMVLGEKREGIKFTYVTDTRPNEEIVEFVRDSNFFVCEGTYGDSEDLDKAIKNTHMTFAEAAMLAKKANVDKLLLTHFSPSMDNPKKYKEEATNIFKNTIIGYDGYKETVTYK